MITVIVDSDPAVRAERAAAIAAEAGAGCGFQPDPVYGFRGLLGWNLGLGLTDEACGLAGQYARRLGLGPLLADPVGYVDASALASMALARLLARPEPLLVHAPDVVAAEGVVALLVEAGRRADLVVSSGDASIHELADRRIVGDPGGAR